MHHRSSFTTRAAVALLAGVFVFGALANDADARRKRRKSRAVRKADAKRRKAEKQRKKAEAERKVAEELRIKAEQDAARANKEADDAKKELEQLKRASGHTAPAAAGTQPGAPTQPADPSRAVPDRPTGPHSRRHLVAEGDDEPRWGGFFLSFNIGYATSGGKAGPTIPDPRNGAKINLTPGILRAVDFQRYSKGVTTDVGAGVAVDLQIGYNIKGYVSIWADISGHGSPGAKSDLAGAAAGAFMLGFHPLRFWRPDAPVDVRLYGGYGIFEWLGYHEVTFQAEATGKGWLGTNIPFGISTEYRIGDVFALGLDLRFVSATYDRWIYNWDDDMKSDLGTPEFPVTTTFRFEPRVIFGWHF